MLGLVLTAGGACGAYQAGALKRIGEMPAFAEGPSPFAIVTDASAGAINGAMRSPRREARPPEHAQYVRKDGLRWHVSPCSSSRS